MPPKLTSPGFALGRRLFAGAMLLAAILISLWLLPVTEWLDAAGRWIDAHPASGPTLFVLALAGGTVIMIPGSILAMSAGYLFGLPGGLALASAGTTAGAVLACLAGRTLARPLVADAIAGNARFAALDRALLKRGFFVVVLTRLSLMLPYNLLNYAYGVTGIRVGVYALATLVGMLPALALYAYLGTLATNFDDVIAGEMTGGVPGAVITAIGVVAVVLAVWIVHRTATAELKKHMGET